MSPVVAFHIACVAWFFVLGAVVGSFLNVCIYRLPWEKSVLWPASHCPKCLRPIASRDNVPILSWLALRGECRGCGLPISPRYALIEAFVGLLFVGIYAADVGFGATTLGAGASAGRLCYHLLLAALLVAATFTDYDYQVIPDEITRTGMAFGLLLGALYPEFRPPPAGPTPPFAMTTFGALLPCLTGAFLGASIGWAARMVGRFLRETIFRLEPKAAPKPAAEGPPEGETFGLPTIGAFLGFQIAAWPLRSSWGGLVVGLQGFLIGGALVWVVGTVFTTLLRRESMGFGDVTLLAMIGSFLGWQAAVLTFFIAPFFGLAHALWKLVPILYKILTRRKTRAAEHEMPFGPYLAMAALFLLVTWPRLWGGWAGPLFDTIGWLARSLLDDLLNGPPRPVGPHEGFRP